MALSHDNAILPTAPPGPAGKPLAITVCFFSSFVSRIGCNNSSIWLTLNLMTAVCSSMRPSFNMSIAMLTAAKPVRLPVRHCNIYNLPSWIVNSMSSMSL